MPAVNYIESPQSLPPFVANARTEERTNSQIKDEYGDWQTNMELAVAVCRLLKDKGCTPKVVIEPTCGKGHFILAALQVFDTIEEIHGIEIYKPYIDELKTCLQCQTALTESRRIKIHLYHQNVFDFDFSLIKSSLDKREVLVIGNPPWVTNSKLGSINSGNLPRKANFKKLNGMEAITGKANFDIAEYICKQLIEFLSGENARLALLIKNSVIKNIMYEQNAHPIPIDKISQYNIDAKKEFNVCVAASLLCAEFNGKSSKECKVMDFYTHQHLSTYGWSDNHFVSDMDNYNQYCHIDGISPLKWWSGMKHDCSKIMELEYDGHTYTNGLGERVDIEEGIIYPLLKSSDIKGSNITSTRKYVIVTQQSTSDDTSWIKFKYPKAYRYLDNHSAYFEKRGSRIYRGRPRFSIFGIGKYSFQKYKVVVSGLYKKPNFSIVCPINGKPVMMDDTCYLLGFDNLKDAQIAQQIFNSHPIQTFIQSLLFVDAKRVINKDLLMRINLSKALEHLKDIELSDKERFQALINANTSPKQFTLFETAI